MRARAAPFWALVLLVLGILRPLAAQDPAFEAGLARARQFRSAGESEKALQELSGLRAKSVQNPSAMIQVLRETAAVYTERKDFPNATKCLESLVEQSPSDGAAHYQLGLAYRASGDNQRAAEQFQSAMDDGFRNLAVKFHRTAALFDSRQSTAALESARDIIGDSPKAPELLLRVGRLLFEHLYYREALNAFRLAHTQEPAAFEPTFFLALTHYLLKEYAEAATLLKPLADSSGSPEAANLLAASEAENGHTDEASGLLAETTAKWPRSPHAYLNLALLRLEQGRTEEAEDLFGKFRALGPQPDAKVFYSIQGNSCPALISELQAPAGLQRDQVKADFYFDLASQMQTRFHHESAVELLRLVRRYEGDSARLLYASGVSCLNLNSTPEGAVWLLKEAVKLDPQNHDAWYLLGRAYHQERSSQESIAAFRTAAATGHDVRYWVALGKATGATGEAQTAFENALALEPKNAIAHFEYGRLLIQLEKFAEARAHLSRAVELEPDFYEAYYALSRLYARIGDQDQSRKCLILFERTKRAALQQAVAGSGYIAEGREP